jgi:hypothetical protein
VALAYDYAGRRALLEDPPEGEMSPHLYALCITCAEGLRPPLGWTLEDLRSRPPLFGDRSAARSAAYRPEAVEEQSVSESQLIFGSSL